MHDFSSHTPKSPSPQWLNVPSGRGSQQDLWDIGHQELYEEGCDYAQEKGGAIGDHHSLDRSLAQLSPYDPLPFYSLALLCFPLHAMEILCKTLRS